MLAPAMAWCPALLTAAPRRRRGCLSAAGAPGSLLAAAPPRPPFPQALPQFLELRTRRLQFLFQPLLSLYRLAMHSAVVARLPALLYYLAPQLGYLAPACRRAPIRTSPESSHTSFLSTPFRLCPELPHRYTEYLPRHLIAILVELHIKHIRHPPYQAYCKGKIEAANKIIKNQFQREAQVAGIRTLDELNSAFWAWMDLDYNTRILAATGQSPDARFGDGLPPDQRRITDLDSFNALFLWRQRRTVSKYGRIKLHGNQYPVTSVPYGTVVEVRFDPYDLAQLAIYDASGVLIETTSAAKQVTAQVPNIPAESAAKPAQVSAAARAWFTRLREQHHAALRDRNQTSFTRFQSTDDDDKELRDADA